MRCSDFGLPQPDENLHIKINLENEKKNMLCHENIFKKLIAHLNVDQKFIFDFIMKESKKNDIN